MVHESNPQLELAFNFLQYTNQNVFLTGKAGTGKTTFLQDLKLKSPKRMVVVAPTGVAAVNAGGVTIHSFFQLALGPHIPYDPERNNNFNKEEFKRFSKQKVNIIRSLDLLVIDEISMVRADLLDGIDEVLRRFKNRYKPFGGIQLLMIGDLQQLSPIVNEEEKIILKQYYDTWYFFSSHALKKSSFIGIELKHVFRQNDQRFIDLLNKVRLNQLDEPTLQEINKRYIPNFHPDEEEGYIMLTTHNYQSKNTNDFKLKDLDSKSHLFLAEVSGEFPDYSYPTDPELELKVGAQVMFVKNDPSPEKLFYNGKIGKITSIGEDNVEIKCPGDEKNIVVERLEWQNSRYVLDELTQEIKEEVIGTFKQIPLKLAWAITIHKSQGLTFEKAIIDARESFAHGQVYVALSRCKSLEGMVLSSRIGEFSIKNDHTVLQFTDKVERNQPGQSELERARKNFILELLLDLIDFKSLQRSISYMLKICSEHSSSLLGSLDSQLKTMSFQIQKELVEISQKFEPQLRNLIAMEGNPELNLQLQERVKKASEYFTGKFGIVVSQPCEELSFETDNKTLRKSLTEALDKFRNEVNSRKKCLDLCRSGFTIKTYLEAKSKAAIEREEKRGVVKNREEPHAFSQHPDFYSRLKKWRQRKADLLNEDLARILPQNTLNGIANQLPATRDELKSVKGMGGVRMQQFGKEILLLIHAYRKERGMELPLNADQEAELATMDSRTTSLFLFNKGKTVAEIAAERHFAVNTIEGHLAHFVGTGELELDRVVAPEEGKAILSFLEQNQIESLSDIYNALEGKYDYSKIRYIVKYLESQQEKIEMPFD